MSTLLNGKPRRRVVVRPYSLRASTARKVALPEPGDEQVGGWTREQLLRMNERFVVAVEAAFRSGRESPASASAVQRGTTTICSPVALSSAAS